MDEALLTLCYRLIVLLDLLWQLSKEEMPKGQEALWTIISDIVIEMQILNNSIRY